MDKKGRIRPLGRLWPEQVEFVQKFIEGKPILVVKSRQVGITTITIACFVAWMLTAPDAEALIQVTHEGDAVASLNTKARIMLEGLPGALRPVRTRDTANLIELAHNRATLRQRMAGGRSQGRSYSFQHDHYTEMAYWPTGSSAVVGRGVDRQVWASIRATRIDSERARTVVESTANGPAGLYHSLYQAASRNEDEWSLLFWPWFMGDRYTRDLPKKWERTDEENELMSLYFDKGLTDRHLAWRRNAMVANDISLSEFRKSYPSNVNEPFMLSESAVFDLEALNKLAARTDKARCPAKVERVILEPYQPGRRYGIGLDTSGGTGRDFAVCYVVRDDGKMVARWHSKTARPALQAAAVAELSAVYGRAPILVEYNRHGKFVFHELARLGASLWLDEKGKPWWTQRGTSASKDRLIDFAATLVGEGRFLPPTPDESWLADTLVIDELGALRESKTGNLEAPEGGHDDHAMAWMLALWSIRRDLRGAPNRLWLPPPRQVLVPYDRLAGVVG